MPVTVGGPPATKSVEEQGLENPNNDDFGDSMESGESVSSSASSDPEGSEQKAGYFGGKGWVVVAGFFTNFATYGITTTFGLFVPTFVEEFDVELQVAASIVSTLQALQFFGSLGAGFLIPNLLSYRTLAFASAIWSFVGYMVSSFCEDASLLRLTMGLGVGLSLGMHVLAGSTSLQAQVPKEKRGIAIGIASCGSTFGNMSFPSIVTMLMESFGWRNAWRILGIVTSLMMLAAAPFYMNPTETAAMVAASRPPASSDQKTRRCRVLREGGVGFLVWWTNTLLCMTGFFAPYTLLAQFAKVDLMVAPQVAARAYMIIGLVGMPMRLFQGWIAPFMGGSRNLLFFSQFGSGSMTALLASCRSEIAVYGWAAGYGICQGPMLAVTTVVLGDTFGMKNLPMLSGITFCAVGFGSLIGPPLTAILATNMGFQAAFMVAAAFISGSAFLLLTIPWVQRVTGGAPAEDVEEKKIVDGSFATTKEDLPAGRV